MYPTHYVNGLMSIGETIINPSTGKSITLPRVKTSSERRVRRFFGYDPVKDEYKMLRMKENNVMAPCSDFRVFTLGAKEESWRLIDCSVPHSPSPRPDTCVCIDGYVYYMARTGDTGMKQWSLVRFDLKFEKFDIFARVPEHFRVRTLINYYGKVAASVVPLSKNSVDLWVFEAGKQHHLEMSIYNFPVRYVMKGINHMGEIIFAPTYTKEANVIRYDPKASSFKELKIEVAFGPRRFFYQEYYFLDYVESLMLL